MISLLPPDDFTPPPLPGTLLDQLNKLVAHDWEAARDLLWRHAMTFNNGGVMPDEETIREMAHTVIAHDGTHHLLWGHPPIEEGDEIDMDYCIADITPPFHGKKYGNPPEL